MYRVMIVDDEPEIRQGLRLKADWSSLKMRVEAEASNGREALEQLARTPFDLVLADMNMPVMDGRSFLEVCRKEHPATRLIVITGYEDFQYARSAVRSQARDYLLKPVSRDELTAALERIRQELDAERRRAEADALTGWRLTQDYRELKEQFLLQLVKGEAHAGLPVRERAARFELAGWEEREIRILTAGMKEQSAASSAGTGGMPGEERQPDDFRLPFDMIAREFAAGWTQPAEVFRSGLYPGLLHFILPADERESQVFTGQLADTMRSYTGFELCAGIGRPVRGFARWEEGYSSSLLAWNLQAGGAAGEADSDTDVHTDMDGNAERLEETAKRFRLLLRRGETGRLRGEMERVLKAASAVSPARLVKVIFRLYLLLDAAVHEAEPAGGTRERLWLRPERVLGMDTVPKALAFLMEIAEEAVRGSLDVKPREQSAMEQATAYIRENYMYDLPLPSVAERFNYNPSYFSELFKDKIGTPFNQYVTSVRMEQAVRMLKTTGLGLWDIAELSGFSNPSYFSSRFKRIYGVSPSEYRQRYTRKNQ
ncbi:response regulator [Paenibacillus sp. CN-4]|uniref:response regulator n=1 Tax=Paenibacillus nanchangensis TaxID=3348343 RepID=UPI00397B9247